MSSKEFLVEGKIINHSASSFGNNGHFKIIIKSKEGRLVINVEENLSKKIGITKNSERPKNAFIALNVEEKGVGIIQAKSLALPKSGFYKSVATADDPEMVVNLTREICEKKALKFASEFIEIAKANPKEIGPEESQRFARSLSSHFSEYPFGISPENERKSTNELLDGLSRFGTHVQSRMPGNNLVASLRQDIATTIGAMESVYEEGNDERLSGPKGMVTLEGSDALRRVLPEAGKDRTLPAAYALWSSHQSIKATLQEMVNHRDIIGRHGSAASDIGSRMKFVQQYLTEAFTSPSGSTASIAQGISVSSKLLHAMDRLTKDEVLQGDLHRAFQNIETASKWISPSPEAQIASRLDTFEAPEQSKVWFSQILNREGAVGNTISDQYTKANGKTLVVDFSCGEHLELGRGGVVVVKDTDGNMELIGKPGEGLKDARGNPATWMNDSPASEVEANYALFSGTMNSYPDINTMRL